MSRTLTLPTKEMMEAVVAMLYDGMAVTLRAKGRSMHPYIRDGKDSLILHKAETDKIAVGDIVLALTDHDKYVLHRIINIEGDKVTLKGDGNLWGTEECSRQGVKAKLAYIERSDCKIDVNRRSQRFKAWLMRTVWRNTALLKSKIKKLINYKT